MKKQASFGTLNKSVYYLVAPHTVADLIHMVFSKLSMNTGAALHEAQSTANRIVDEVLYF